MILDLTHSAKFRPLIDWEDLFSNLSYQCIFKNNKSFFKNPQFLDAEDKILKSFKEIDDILQNYSALSTIVSKNKTQLTKFDESRNPFARLKEGIVFNEEDLNEIASYLEFNQSLFEFEGINEFRFLNLNKVINPIRKLINIESAIEYQKHPLISKQYEKLKQTELKIRKMIERLVNSEKFKNKLQLNEYDFVYDKFLLPVKSNSYSSSLGKIIDHSNTGSTLYVEPLEIIDLNQNRQIEETKLQELILKELRIISENIISNKHEILSTLSNLEKFEIAFLKANISKTYNLKKPLLDQGNIGHLELEGLFHPLIDEPVTNNLILKNNLCISGPNTGGKTVLIKSSCLALILFRLGIFINAESAKIPFFNKIYFFGNDSQDLQRGLSSFASECENYLNCLDHADSKTIVFIDEIFNSTSSEEATALAMALLEELNNKEAKVIVSTHHFQLKLLLQEESFFESAHMGFDNKTYMPSYKLYIGTPGSSHAIDIFSRLSSRDDLPQKALSYMNEDRVNLEKRLAQIEDKENKLDILIKENREVNNKLKSKEAASKLQIEKEKNEIIQVYKKKIISVLEKAENLKKESKSLSKSAFYKEHDAIKEIINDNSKRPSSSKINLARPLEIVKGGFYFSQSLGIDVKVLDLKKDKSQAFVGHSVFKSWVKIDDLFSSQSKKKVQQSLTVLKERSSKIDYDFRGLKYDEAESLLETILSDLLSGDTPFVNIIHGHGNGVLKKLVRERLEKDVDFEWNSEKGNDGVTLIKLK